MHWSKLAGACLLPLHPVFAHGFAGPHMAISTLLIDDPNVADEASRSSISTSTTCSSTVSASRS
jgi:hypothetical protein